MRICVTVSWVAIPFRIETLCFELLVSLHSLANALGVKVVILPRQCYGSTWNANALVAWMIRIARLDRAMQSYLGDQTIESGGRNDDHADTFPDSYGPGGVTFD